MNRNNTPDRPGYFKRRFVKAGPWVPSIIVWGCRCSQGGGDPEKAHRLHRSTPECDRYRILVAYQLGKEKDPQDIWERQEIDKSEYHSLVESLEGAKEQFEETGEKTPLSHPFNQISARSRPLNSFVG